MLTRNARRLAFVAAILGLVLLVRVWIDHRARDDNVPRSSFTDAQGLVSPAPGRVGLDEPTSGASNAVGSSGVPHGVTGATVDGTRLRLEVRAPSDVRVGEVFEVRIEIDANAALRDLMFSIAYAKSRLALVGWSRGNFAQQLPDLPADLGAEEPSDGNVQVTYKVSNELSATGAGTLAVFQLEALKPGTSPITLQNVSASDVGGDMDPHAFVLHDGQVTVH
jgi:hypothetical protein